MKEIYRATYAIRFLPLISQQILGIGSYLGSLYLFQSSNSFVSIEFFMHDNHFITCTIHVIYEGVTSFILINNVINTPYHRYNSNVCRIRIEFFQLNDVNCCWFFNFSVDAILNEFTVCELHELFSFYVIQANLRNTFVCEDYRQ